MTTSLGMSSCAITLKFGVFVHGGGKGVARRANDFHS